MHTAVLCIGSNVAPRRRNIDQALLRLGEIASIMHKSDIAESPDYTHRSGDYLNIVVTISTELPIEEFREKTSYIEKEGGRTENSHSTGIVAIDIDIVLWNEAVVSPSDFNRPHFTTLYKKLIEAD